MSYLTETQLSIFNNFVRDRDNKLTELPMKVLKKELERECRKKKVADIDGLLKYLSKERRREKKAEYSKEERKRNKADFHKDKVDLFMMREELEILKKDKIALEQEIAFYEEEIMKYQDTTYSLDVYEIMFPKVLTLLLEENF